MEAQRQAGLPKRMTKGLCGLILRIDLLRLLLFRADLLGPVQLQDRRHAPFPYALLCVGLLVRLFAAAQLAFDGQMSALRERLRVLGQPAPDDAAMPLGMAVVLAGLLVLVAGLGGKREYGEAGVVRGAGDGVVAEEADERNAILIHGESPLFEFPDWPGHPLAKPERGARLPSAKPRILEQGPKLDLGEESGKQSGDVPPGAGCGPKRVTGQSRDRNERRAFHDLHRPRYSRLAKPALLTAEPSHCRLLKRPERRTDIPPLRVCWRDSPPAKKRRAYLPRFVTAKGHGKRLVWDVSSVRVTRRPGRPGSGR